MKHVKDLRNIFVLLMISGLLLSGCSSVGSTKTGTSNTGPKYIVGYTNYISGNLAAQGKVTDASIRMAMDDFNKTAKVPIELNFSDVGSTPITAKNGMDNLLASNPKSILIIQSSTQYSGDQDLLAAAKIPVVSSAIIPSIYEHGWNWLFGMQTTSKDEVKLALKYWHEKLGKSKIAALLPNDDTGKTVLAALKEEAAAENVTLIPVMTTPGDNDYTANITAARRENPDFYYAYSMITPDLGRLVKQMRQLGIPATSISVQNHIANNDFLALLSAQDAEGLIGHMSAYLNKDDPKVQDWLKHYKEVTGNDGDAVTLMVYDQAMILFNAVEKNGNDSQKIIDYLHSTPYQGLAGSYKFDSKGLGRHDTNILKIGPDKTVKLLERAQ